MDKKMNEKAKQHTEQQKEIQSSQLSQGHMGLLSIGGLAKICGIPVETLRNWERRYGFPEPERRDSGHRRYSWDWVGRLKQIKDVLDLGYKPSFAVKASLDEIDQILNSNKSPSEGIVSPLGEDLEAAGSEIELWLDKVLQMDSQRLARLFIRAWHREGAWRFIIKLAVPFLRQMGKRWEDGRFSVAHEHFASDVMQTFLAGQWRPLAGRGINGKVVLANLEGEYHSLRLHMAAVFLVLHDFEPLYLGPSTPVKDIVGAVNEMGAHSLVIGLSPSSDLKNAREQLESISAEIPNSVQLIYGGNGTPFLTKVGMHIETFDTFFEWCGQQSHA